MRRVFAACAAVVLAIATPSAAASPPRAKTGGTGSRPLAISGVVVDSDGHPLSNAVVSGSPLSYGPLVGRVRTGADGRFRLPLQTAGAYAIDVTGRHARGGNSDATGYAETDRILAAGRDAVRIRLDAGGAIRGTVTDDAGHPLAGVNVAAGPVTPYLEPDAIHSYSVYYYANPITRTDAHGRYLLRGVGNIATIPCAIPRHATGGNHDAAGYAQRCAPNAIAVAPHQIVTAPSVALQPRVDGALTGTVTGPQGAPLRNVVVEINPSRASAYLGFVVTDANGQFTKTDVPLGHAQVCPYADGTAGRGVINRCRVVTVTRGAPTDASLRLARGGAVSGRLLTPTHSPVGGAPVQVDPVTDSANSGFGYTDARGDFTVGGLKSGRYRVCFRTSDTPGGPGATGVAPGCLGHTITVTAGRIRHVADRILALGGAVAGTVTDSSGHLLQNISLLFRASRGGRTGSGNTGVHGTYLSKNLAPGRYRPCAIDTTYAYGQRQVCLTRTITVARGHTVRGVDLVFPMPTAVRATVTDAQGHPLSGVEVAALRKCRGDGCPIQPVFSRRPVTTASVGITDATGTVDVQHLTPGRYAVCALAYYAASPLGTPATGYADKCTGSTFTVSVARATTTRVRLQLAPAGSVTGRVTKPNGHGIRGAAIDIAGSAANGVEKDPLGIFEGLDASPSPFDDDLTDAHGAYTIHSVQPGQRQLCARQARGYQDGCASTDVTISGGSTTSAPTLVLQPGQASSKGTRRPAIRPAARQFVRRGQRACDAPRSRCSRCTESSISAACC